MLATKPTNGVAPKPRAGHWPASIPLRTYASLAEAVKAFIDAATELGHSPADDIRDAIDTWANAGP